MDKKKVYLFIDESGDASFYAKGNKCIVGSQGFMANLFLGMIKIENKKLLRNAILNFMDEIKKIHYIILYHALLIKRVGIYMQVTII